MSEKFEKIAETSDVWNVIIAHGDMEKKDLKHGALNRLECNYSTQRYGEKKT